jgi:hypothetical protein
MQRTPYKLMGEVPHGSKHKGVCGSNGELRSVGREGQKDARGKNEKQSSSEQTHPKHFVFTVQFIRA